MESKVTISQLFKAAVYTLEEGIRLGRFADAYIDKPARRVKGIAFKAGAWGVEKISYIAFDDILTFGPDLILVSTQGSVREISPEDASNSFRALKGYKVTTQAGKHIGELLGLNIERKSGSITDIILPDNTLLAVEGDTLVIGPDAIIAPADYLQHLRKGEAPKEENRGRIFDPDALAETLREGFESVRKSSDADKWIESFKINSEKARDSLLRTSQKIQETIDQFIKKSEREKSRGGDESASRPADSTSAPQAGEPAVDEGRRPEEAGRAPQGVKVNPEEQKPQVVKGDQPEPKAPEAEYVAYGPGKDDSPKKEPE